MSSFLATEKNPITEEVFNNEPSQLDAVLSQMNSTLNPEDYLCTYYEYLLTFIEVLILNYIS